MHKVFDMRGTFLYVELYFLFLWLNGGAISASIPQIP